MSSEQHSAAGRVPYHDLLQGCIKMLPERLQACSEATPFATPPNVTIGHPIALPSKKDLRLPPWKKMEDSLPRGANILFELPSWHGMKASKLGSFWIGHTTDR